MNGNCAASPKNSYYFSGISGFRHHTIGGGGGVVKSNVYLLFCTFFTEEISDDDLIIDVDNSLARQLYKRWEKTVQVLNCTAIYCGNSLGTKVFIHFLLSCFRRERGFLLAKKVG